MAEKERKNNSPDSTDLFPLGFYSAIKLWWEKKPLIPPRESLTEEEKEQFDQALEATISSNLMDPLSGSSYMIDTYTPTPEQILPKDPKEPIDINLYRTKSEMPVAGGLQQERKPTKNWIQRIFWRS
jgi:hypothetical protein